MAIRLISRFLFRTHRIPNRGISNEIQKYLSPFTKSNNLTQLIKHAEDNQENRKDMIKITSYESVKLVVNNSVTSFNEVFYIRSRENELIEKLNIPENIPTRKLTPYNTNIDILKEIRNYLSPSTKSNNLYLLVKHAKGSQENRHNTLQIVSQEGVRLVVGTFVTSAEELFYIRSRQDKLIENITS